MMLLLQILTRTYSKPDWIAELTAMYYAMVEEVDYWVGGIKNTLQESGMDEKTLLIFT